MADFLNIEDVIKHLDIKDDMMAAEFGCGAASFAVALARKMSKGRVYALDVQEQKLSALQGRLNQQKISNVFTVHCDLEAPKGSTLGEQSMDIVLMPNLLFQVDNKDAIITEAHRVLRNGGQMLVVDWMKVNAFGPHKLVKPEEIKASAEKIGFALKKEFLSGDYHFGLLFSKK